MNEGYSAVLTRCMLLSALGLGAGIVFPLPAFVPFGLALVPLIWYHLGYLKKYAGDGISQPAVDSVYYYGFLVTIGALGATAVELSIKGIDGDLSKVAFQFGLGLLATGYAVWARINLTASSEMLDEANLEEEMHKYVQRSREMVSTVELATVSFNTFADTLISKSEAFANPIETQTESAIEAATRRFGETIGNMSEEAQLSLADMRAVLNDTTFGDERQQLRRSVSSMVKTVTSLSSVLEDLKVSSASGAATVNEFAGQLGAVHNNARAASMQLETLGKREGVVANFAVSLEDCHNKIEQLSLSSDVASASTTRFGDTLSASVDPVVELANQSRKSATDVGKLSIASDLSDKLEKSVAQSAGHFESFGSRVSEFSGTPLTELTLQLTTLQSTLHNLNAALIDSTGGLKDSMTETSQALEVSLTQAVETAEALSARLVKASEQSSFTLTGDGYGNSQI